MPQKSLKLIGGYISSYCSILNSTKWLDMIRKANKLVDVIGDIESYFPEAKEKRKKIVLQSEDHSKNKTKWKQRSKNEDISDGIQTGSVQICSIFEFGM